MRRGHEEEKPREDVMDDDERKAIVGLGRLGRLSKGEPAQIEESVFIATRDAIFLVMDKAMRGNVRSRSKEAAGGEAAWGYVSSSERGSVWMEMEMSFPFSGAVVGDDEITERRRAVTAGAERAAGLFSGNGTRAEARAENLNSAAGNWFKIMAAVEFDLRSAIEAGKALEEAAELDVSTAAPVADGRMKPRI